MKKCNIDNAPIKKVKKDYFTGPVTLREISRITKPTEHDIYHVTFKKSARTKLHFCKFNFARKFTNFFFVGVNMKF